MAGRDQCQVTEAAELSARGVQPGTPAALTINGTMDDQRVFHGTVPTLSSLAAHVGDDQTGLFIIGEVAALGRELAWFGEKPAYEVAA